jgi:hypothetical protein
MIKDKHYYRKKTVILTFIYSLTVFTLASCTYATLAWFSSQRSASVNFESITVGAGFSVKMKYLSYNAQTEDGTVYYHGYKRADISTLDTSFSYAQNFIAFDETTTSGPLGSDHFAPLYASTYCFEVTFSSGGVSFDAALTSFTAPASTTEYSDTLSSYICLSEAVDVFTGYSDGTNLDADAKAFLEATTGDAATDRFSHTGSSLTEGESDSWNPANTMTILEGGVGYFFVTEYFSNDSSTFYSPVSGSDNHWVHNTEGTSNPYEGLSILLTGMSINRAV